MQQTNQPPSDKLIKEARHKLWELGILNWKLTPTQRKIYDFYFSGSNKTICVNASRRLGKSFLLAIIAIETCLKTPKSIVKFLQPELKMVRTNIRPIMNEILVDCPTSLAPHFHTMDNIYRFPNGSEIHLAGTDNGNYNKLRGGDAHLCLVDEAGFCSDLSHIIQYILTPTTLLTGGRIILSSTTPPDPGHEFIKQMNLQDTQGAMIRKSIYDALEDDRETEVPRITEGIIGDIIKSYPEGAKSDAFRTEYLCEVITDSKDSVVPEFTAEVAADVCIPWPRPPHFDAYTSMDIGFKDWTVVLFAYWDFVHGVLVIEDEFKINGHEMTTRALADGINDKEQKLWTHHLSGEFKAPYRRIADNNLILINDLAREHGLFFSPTDKHNKDAYLNQLRMLVQNRQIYINPRCKILINHLTGAMWDKSRKDYRKSKEEGHHYDAVDALTYLVRNLDMQRNPYPKGYSLQHMGSSSNLFLNERYRDPNSSPSEKLGLLFAAKKKR